MLKSLRNSKAAFLILNILFSLFSSAQTNMVGSWATKEPIGLRDTDEYSIVKQKDRVYGNALVLKQDGKFYNENLAECLNGSSVLPYGTYTLIDDFHIRFIIEDVHIDGLYAGMVEIKKSDFIKDLGIFYIYKEKNSIRLIKSNGVLQDDKDKMLYTEMLNAFDKNWKSYNYSWIKTKGTTPAEIVKNCIDQKSLIDFSSCQILYSKKQKYGEVFLIKEKENFRYVIFSELDQKISLAYPR